MSENISNIEKEKKELIEKSQNELLIVRKQRDQAENEKNPKNFKQFFYMI